MTDKTFDQLPSKPGDYCYWSRGCCTAVPVFASFDGEKWLGHVGDVDMNGCFWIDTDNPEPLGSENRQYAAPEVQNDLQSRLERYKAAKVSR